MIALPDAPAPTSSTLEDVYYVKTNEILNTIKRILKNKQMNRKVPFFDDPRHYLDDREVLIKIFDEVGKKKKQKMQKQELQILNKN